VSSAFMVLTALQPQSEPKATPRSTRWCEIGQHSAWHTLVPFARAIACSVTVAREIALRNKIPAAHVLRRLVLIPTFCCGALRESTAVHRRLSTSPETVWLVRDGPSFALLSKSQGPRRSARVIDRHASALQTYVQKKLNVKVRSARRVKQGNPRLRRER